MTEETAQFLVSAAGAGLLETLARIPGSMSDRALKAKRVAPGVTTEQVSGAVSVLDARERLARRGFPGAETLFLTPEMAAQASSPGISRWHASLLAENGRVVDLCAGAGIDSLAFASAGLFVDALELDPARAILAAENVRVSGFDSRVTTRVADATTDDWVADTLFFDPARRDSARGRVSAHAELYAPPLSFLSTARRRALGGIAKLSPALPDDILEETAGQGGRVVFVSERRECKEAAIVFGTAARELPESTVIALLLNVGAGGAHAIFPRDDSEFPGGNVSSETGAFVFDPDPAIIRAGALGTLCERLGAARVSLDDAYLTGDELGESVIGASAYRVRWTELWRPRELAATLKRDGIGRLVVKKRRFPHEPPEVAKLLKLSGKGAEATLFLIADGPRHIAVLADPVTPDAR